MTGTGNNGAEIDIEGVRRLAWKFKRRFPRAEFDDLFSVGCVGLMRAAKTHREDGGASIRTHGLRRAWGEMMDLIGIESEHGKVISMGQWEEDVAVVGEADPADTLLDCDDQWEALTKPLCKRSKAIVLRFARDGLTRRAISRETGLSESRVGQIIREAGSILRTTTLSHVGGLPKQPIFLPPPKSRPVVDSAGCYFPSLKAASKAAGRSARAVANAATNGWRCAGRKWRWAKENEQQIAEAA